MAPFDPYHIWLDIPPDEQPPTPHRLLGIAPDETDKEIIREAALQRNAFIRKFSLGEQGKIAERLLNEIAAARDNTLAGNVQTAVETRSAVKSPIQPVVEKVEPVGATPATAQALPPEEQVDFFAATPVSPPLFVNRGPPVQQESQAISTGWSTFKTAEQPQIKAQNKSRRRLLSVVGVIGVLVILISLMFSGDADPVARTDPPVVTSLPIPTPQAEAEQKSQRQRPAGRSRLLERAQNIGGLIAYYPFNGNANDESGNGHDTTVSSPVLMTDRFDIADSAYLFDGVGDVIKQSNATLMPRGMSDFTVSLWANATNIAGDARVFLANEKLDQFQFAIMGLSQNELQMYLGGSRLPVSTGALDWDLNQWYQVAATRLGDQVSIYRNGELLVTTTNSSSINVSDNESVLSLGSRRSTNNRTRSDHPWHGQLDDIRIYNRALSAAEVKALYDFESKPPASPLRTAPAIDSITNIIGMKLNLIPAGTFTMGSPEGEEGRRDNETQHPVTISKPFYMQTTEVTQGQWKEVMGTEPWKVQSFVKEGPDYAATYVSWDDAVAYCKKLSDKEGKTYRLPTEAEWEYACRAGTETAWSFGDDEKVLGDYAWYKENAWDFDEKYAHQVGLKIPNAFGLYDMHGNVYEWCHDYYEEVYYKQSPEQDPQGPASGSFRVLRGGSWSSGTRGTRSAGRGRGGAGFLNFGFRLVRELD